MVPSCLRAFEQMRDVTEVAVQPALGLDEIEEEHACEGGERERVPIGARPRRAQPFGQLYQRVPKGAKEAGCDSLAREHLADSQRQRERRLVRGRRQPLERREGGSRRGGEVDGCHAQADRARRANEAPRLSAQGTGDASLRAGRKPSRRAARRELRIDGLEAKDPKCAVARDERRAGDSVRIPEPRLDRQRLPRGLVAERGEEFAEVLDLRCAGENVAQHQKPLVREGLR